MKRTILTAIALIIGVAASAQSDKDRTSFDFSLKRGTNDKHEVRLTVGSAPLFEDDFFIYDDVNIIVPQYTGMIYPEDLYYRGALKTSGGYALSYMYSPCRWFSVGMYAGYVSQWQKTHLHSTQATVSTTTERHLMFVPTVRFTYLNRPLVRLYSSIGVGVGFCHERTRNVDGQLEFSANSRFCPAEVTFLGVSVGRRLFGFAELNIGSMGCCSAGIGYKF
ncbi:MAG: hypothetical protein IKU92_02725 [Rikenellaceae bacterium]|nr:hypothetical protein [Rikenellaceae bacterium]